jgi:hypothetical protein
VTLQERVSRISLGIKAAAGVCGHGPHIETFSIGTLAGNVLKKGSGHRGKRSGWYDLKMFVRGRDSAPNPPGARTKTSITRLNEASQFKQAFSMLLNAQRDINKRGRTRLPSFPLSDSHHLPAPPPPPPPRSPPSPLPLELEISAARLPTSRRTHTRGARGSVPGAETHPVRAYWDSPRAR